MKRNDTYDNNLRGAATETEKSFQVGQTWPFLQYCVWRTTYVLKGGAIFPSRIAAQTQEYIQKYVKVFEKCSTRPITVTVFLDIWNPAAENWDFGWFTPYDLLLLHIQTLVLVKIANLLLSEGEWTRYPK